MLIIIVVVLVAIAAYNMGKDRNTYVAPIPTISSTPSASPVSEKATYSDSQLSFEYPKILTQAKSGDTVVVAHAVQYVHPDLCDFKGDAAPKKEITDFAATFKVIPTDLKTSVVNNHGDWDYASKNPLTLGQWTGYHTLAAVEGCGIDTTYLKITPAKTLIIIRPIVSEFQPINANYQKYLALPGIIKPETADEYFKEIIASLQVK